MLTTSDTIGDIAKRIAKAMEEVQTLKPEGWNAFHKYNYFEITQVMSEARRVLAKNGVVFFPTVTEVHEEVLRGVGNKADSYRFLVTLTTRFIAAESGEYLENVWKSEGVDTGDKALNKAYTAAIKQCLQKTLLIGGDADPDGLAPEKDAAPGRPIRQRLEESQPKNPKTRDRSGKTNPPKVDQQAQKTASASASPLEDQLGALLALVPKDSQCAFADAIEAFACKEIGELSEKEIASLSKKLIAYPAGAAREEAIKKFVKRYTPPPVEEPEDEDEDYNQDEELPLEDTENEE